MFVAGDSSFCPKHLSGIMVRLYNDFLPTTALSFPWCHAKNQKNRAKQVIKELETIAI
jgi:hypothetical protein